MNIEQKETENLTRASQKLDSCPFCGRKDNLILTVNPYTMFATASCETCNVKMKRSFSGNDRIRELLEELMADAWNKRADPKTEE